jgi:16S rRNA (cytosine967-C5)-methyltransferase
MKKIIPTRPKAALPLPRPLAVEILNRVEMDGSFAEPLLDQYLSQRNMSDERDRRLLTELVYGTLRMQGYLDWLIEQFYTGGIRTLEPVVRNIIRTALYQRFFTERIPDFAIVNEAVELIKGLFPRRASLVNAILRNVIRRHDAMPRPDFDEASPDYVAVVHSHPEWLVRRWFRFLGPEETVALCRADNQIPPLFLRANRLHGQREMVLRELSDAGFTAKETAYSPDGLRVMRAAISLRDTACYQNGLVQIQDEASQMIARLVAPVAGNLVLDLCAGIGGKATHLAEIMGNRGRIVAVDISETKITALKALTARLGSTIVEPLVADALADLGGGFHSRFDKVLVDVPCSGVGTLRRAPEIKWRLTPRNIKGFTGIQEQLISRAALYVKPGGCLVYSTCSILAEENEVVVNAFLSAHKDFSLKKPQDMPEVLLDGAFFRTYPHRHDTDGFFGAVMVRRQRNF